MNMGLMMMVQFPYPGWTPLIDPLYERVPHLTVYWMWLVVPLVLVISVVYQTARVAHVSAVPIASLWMSLKIIAAFSLLGISLELIYHYLTLWSVSGHV